MVLGSVSDISVFYWSRIRMRLMVLFVGWHLDSYWHWTQYNPHHNWHSQDIEFWRRNGDEGSNLHIYIYPTLSSSLSHPSLWPLSVAGGWMCVMSTESNGKLLKVFSKSFVFTKLLFVDHGLAEQLDARWNWSIVLSFKQIQDKYLIHCDLWRGNWKICWLVAPQFRTLSALSSSLLSYCLLVFQVNILSRVSSQEAKEWII